VPAVVQEDWLQRYSWAVALALLVGQLLSLVLALRILLGKSASGKGDGKRRILLPGLAALALDAFVLWLCLDYAPTKFDTNLAVIVRQFPDVGVTLIPALALAIVWPIPRTVWLLAKIRTGSNSG
jgi:hypothetical protein